jgi:arylsulfatase A-like enzyme
MDSLIKNIHSPGLVGILDSWLIVPNLVKLRLKGWLFLGIIFCTGTSFPPEETGRSLLPPPNVVFLSVDTLRADRLGCYTCERSITPSLDAFAKEALVFENCVSEIPLTGPSFGAMLTSQYPRMTGAILNGIPVPESIIKVPEIFHNAGYQTFCVQSNWPLKADLCGLQYGFDVYEDSFGKKRVGEANAERYADEVTELALAFLKKWERSRPLFCWIHYSDPHAPYRFHKEFNPDGSELLGMDREVKVRAKYNSEVAFTDHHLGRLLSSLPRENTFVLFVADHGESLYEHGYLGHGKNLYEVDIHVPLMIRGPNISSGKSTVPVCGIDIGTTLLGLAGLKSTTEMLGRDILTDKIMEDRVHVIETYTHARVGGAYERGNQLDSLMSPTEPLRQAILSNGWKLIQGMKKCELYQTSQDLMEEHDIALNYQEKVRELSAMMETWESKTPVSNKTKSNLNNDDVESLKNLGYL